MGTVSFMSIVGWRKIKGNRQSPVIVDKKPVKICFKSAETMIISNHELIIFL